MAGKHLHPRSHSLTFSSSATSVALVFIPLSLLAFILLYTFSSSHVPPQNPSLLSSPNPKPDFSFVSSLEKFLLVSRSATEQTLPDPIDGHEAAAKDLDSRIWWREVERLYEKPYDPTVLRIYVYDMPKKFTYDLLWLFRNTYRETTNLTSNGSPVHRLIEQHAVDYWLWADLIAPESERLLKNVVRVQRQEDANLFYIPFFTTISFFLMEKQQCKALYREALKWVTDQPAWQRSEGRDHILPVHHPWSFKSVRRFMKKAIWLLPDMDSTGNWSLFGTVFVHYY